MGPRVLLSRPNTSGLEAQVLGPYSNETFPQAGRKAIQAARTADIHGPLWNRRKFQCRVGFRRHYHLIVEDIQIRRVTVLPAKGIGRIEETCGSLSG